MNVAPSSTAPTSRTASSFWVWLAISALSLIVIVVPFLLLVEAPPPRRLVIATGRADGAYHKFAQRYAELLRANGVTLELRSTQGSVENLRLLRDPAEEIDVALVQGGIAEPELAESLEALCSLYWEPLWIFYRGETEIHRLTQMEGLRIAVGPEGSGTRGIALQLLKANGINADSATFVDLAGTSAASALQNKQVDVAFFVAGVDTGYIQELLRHTEIGLVELSEAKAYSRRFRFLSTITIPAGGLLDLRDHVPARDTVLISPCATLMCRKTLHPALISLLLNAATKVHSSGDLLTNPGEFPSMLHTDLPVSEHAQQYFRYGPPVLQRLLPFWMASFVDRMKIMIIPLIMLLMPLIRAAPPLVRWRTRRKVYLWYARLRQIDRQSIQGMTRPEAEQSLEKLKGLEQQLANVGIPLSYMEEYYNLRVHLDLVRTRVADILARQSQAAS